MPDPDILPGLPPDPDEEALTAESKAYWRKVATEAPLLAVARVEDAAKQLVALTGGLQGLYFAVFALGGLGQRIPAGLVWVFLAPVVLWLASLFCATLVFVPRARPGADLNALGAAEWLHVRDTYFAVGDQKLRRLHWAHGCLVASFVAVLLLLAVLAVQPTLAPGPTQILIVTPAPLHPPTP